MRKTLTFCFCLGLLTFMGCSTARKVSIRPGRGGILAIPHSEAGRGKAESIMRDVCGEKKVQIVEERESVIGDVIEKSSDRTEKGHFSIGDSSSDHSKRKLSREERFSSQNEWRIQFECQ